MLVSSIPVNLLLLSCYHAISSHLALASTRATGARVRDEPQDERYRVVKIDEKMRVLKSVHKDPAGGHFGIHKT